MAATPWYFLGPSEEETISSTFFCEESPVGSLTSFDTVLDLASSEMGSLVFKGLSLSSFSSVSAFGASSLFSFSLTLSLKSGFFDAAVIFLELLNRRARYCAIRSTGFFSATGSSAVGVESASNLSAFLSTTFASAGTSVGVKSKTSSTLFSCFELDDKSWVPLFASARAKALARRASAAALRVSTVLEDVCLDEAALRCRYRVRAEIGFAVSSSDLGGAASAISVDSVVMALEKSDVG
mmetsp:Transcript_10821/g.23781  ORF Transcript_10821/g.23781 Transcript_10821/m.23781 type:complete len:239 (+) Transcript_10821:1307-2023(+)